MKPINVLLRVEQLGHARVLLISAKETDVFRFSAALKSYIYGRVPFLLEIIFINIKRVILPI